jgi:hypothetical protein
MKDNHGAPFLGNAPREYDRAVFDRVFRTIELNMQQILSVGPIRVSSINISHLPTSDTGLRSGDLWVDTDTVKVVP